MSTLAFYWVQIEAQKTNLLLVDYLIRLLL
jgi:hypothetical protein